MKITNKRSVLQRYGLLLAAGVFAVGLAACGHKGDTGATGATGASGPPGPPGPPGGTVATALAMTITGATVNSAPVVNFTVTDQTGSGYAGLVPNDLRFDIAKLIPQDAVTLLPSRWQNYIIRTRSGAAGTFIQGNRETPDANAQAGAPGSLVNHGDGTYTYYFQTDITTVSCPSGVTCQDTFGNPIDLSFHPDYTHRVGIQTRGSVPMVNATFDFVPNGAPLFQGNSVRRDMLKTATCNQCHGLLRAHDARIEVKYCVTCHNPGSTDAVTGNTVDFKVFLHKLHYSEELPSVQAGGTYAIGNNDFSDIVFPADVRSNGKTNPMACTKCHDSNDTDTPQAINYNDHPSRAACGSCHDDVVFDGSTPGPNQITHPGGAQLDDSKCTTCHTRTVASTDLPGSPIKSHTLWDREYAKYCYQYNIISVVPGGTPDQRVITFSVTNPNPNKNLSPDVGGTTPPLANDAKCSANPTYNVSTDPAFTTGGGVSRLAIDVGWDTRDYNNLDSATVVPTGTNPAQPISITANNNPTVVTDNGDGTFSVTTTLPAAALTLGTGVVAIEGHPAEIDPATGLRTVRVPVTAAIKYFGIADSTPVARREVVDIANCDNCHTRLSLHGSNRTDEPRLCVICHNPNDTDVNRRPKNANGLPDATVTLDGKKEEAIDFKRLIHGIHAAAQTLYDGTPHDGFREKGLVIYGFGGGPNDFSDVHFPGILSNCSTCHKAGTNTLQGIWELPTQNGILGSTIDTAPLATDAGSFATLLATPTDDSNISPTAAVCSSCHDGTLARAHMEDNGGLFGEPIGPAVVTQSDLNGNVEACAVCHGPGRIADIEVVHPKP